MIHGTHMKDEKHNISKNFCNMSTIEVAEVLIVGKLEGDTIPLPTVRASLAVVVPLLEEKLKGDINVLNELVEKKQDFTEWKKEIDHLTQIIKGGKKILDTAH